MASWEPDEIDFEDQYDKVDPIDDADLDASMNELNESIREQEELESRITRAEWTSTNKDERTKLEQQIVFNEKKQGEYIMRASKTIISILHRGFNKIKQEGKVMVLDEKSAEKLYSRLRLVESDEGTYKVVFENESGTYKDILSSTNRWLGPDAYLKIFGKKFMKDMGFDVNKPRTGTKSKIPKKRVELIEKYIDEMYDNTKQFAASELKELPTTSENNQDNIMLQDIITKNEIAADNSVKLIETSLTETGADVSTQTGGLTLRELEGLDKELRTISGSLRSAIAKSIAKQVDIDRENRKLEEMANDETYSDEQREEVLARLQRFQDEQKAISDQTRILKGRYSNQIYQIRESILKFLDKETSLGERIRTLFREQGITIVSILTALGMTIGVLIEALLGGPSASAPTPQSTTTSDKKGGAREWIKNKLKALSSLLGKLADKALTSLPGIIGSILSWILNRAKEVVGWLSQNLWALITGVGVLIYTYFMTKTRRR